MLPPAPFPLQESERPASPVLASGKEDGPATPWSSKPLTRHGRVTVHGASSQAWWGVQGPLRRPGAAALELPIWLLCLLRVQAALPSSRPLTPGLPQTRAVQPTFFNLFFRFESHRCS